MSRLLLKTLMFGLLVSAVTACSNSIDAPKVSEQTRTPNPVDIGNILFPEKQWPKYPEDAVAADPIRLPLCHLTVLNRVDVPTKEDGTIEWLGVEIKGKQNNPPADLFDHVRSGKQYRRLRIGDRVNKGDVIALLNDDRAVIEDSIANSNIKGAEAQVRAAADAIKYYEANVEIEVKANSSKAAIVGAQASLAKAIQEKAAKEWDVHRYEGEKQKADEKLRNHSIKAPITGEVIQLLKQVGEGVKASEPVLQIQNTDRLGIEGNLEVQYASRIAPRTEVYLEPAIMESPQPLRSPHTSSKPIAAVATGVYDNKQVIISASEDGTVKVWDRNAVYATWKHDGPVRALACSKSHVLTGCDDGKARLWSINDVGLEPALKLDGHHEGGVQAAAFSPDGAFCVTSDDRGEIFLFDTATGKRLFQFPHEHNGSVTSLRFTPQCRVVSAGRDNMALVWKVGDKSASVEHRFDHRSGEVTNLGVTDDGGEMLLDLDKNRLRVVDLNGDHNRGTLQQPSDSKFAGFALFSPKIGGANDRVILTSGGSDGILQLWRWTDGDGRGSELKKLVCTNYAPATCAAFSAEAENGFIVAGTAQGRRPRLADAHPERNEESI